MQLALHRGDGVPLPFAPGDLVLVVGGIAIAGGRVNPILIATSALLTCIVGATLGRQLTVLPLCLGINVGGTGSQWL